MSMQDLEADLTRCKQMQEAAAKCYWESKFDQSEELYRAALAVLETVYATDSGNIATCLQGLGDSYYFQDKFGLALPYYKRLLASRERMVDTDAVEYITALFKLAKTYDKLCEWDECEQTYKRAAATAQKRLFMGHPLLTSLLEAYAKFLKRVKPGTEHGIEQQATLSREKYVDPELLAANILEGVGGEKTDTSTASNSDSGKKGKIWFSKSVSEDSDHWFVKLMMELKGSPLKTFGFLLSPFIVAFIFFLGSVAYELIVDESPQNAIVTDGQVYQTADGHERVSFSKTEAVISEQAGTGVKRPYTLLSNRWRELFFALSNGNAEPWTVKTANNLITESGLTLIPVSDPTTKMAPIMARLADQFYEEVNRVKDLRTIKLAPYTSPFSGLYMTPTFVAYDTDLGSADGTERVTSSENFKKLIANATTYDDLQLRLLPKVIKPGSVLCLLLYATSHPAQARFFVLGVGKDGQLIQGCRGSKSLYFQGGKGLAPTASCDSAEPIRQSRLILARRIKSSIAESNRLLGWDLILLLPFLICTLMLENQFSAKQLSDKAVRAKIALLQVAIFLYFPFAFAYMCFTIFVIAKALD